MDVIAATALALSLLAGDSTNVYRGTKGELAVTLPRVQNASIRIDARLDEPAWQYAAVLTGFTLYEPSEGVPATDDTEVLVFYGEDAIHFGIRAFDGQPDRIRATLAERDRSAFSDDWIRIMLDTYGEGRQAYVFYVNPYGIQTDGIWQEGRESRMPGGPPIDFSPDYIWSSDGRLDEHGWTAEIRIPYVSLRFHPEARQDWGINIARETRRNGFKTSWAPLTKNRASTLAQNGRLLGLEELHAQRLIELNPVMTGKRLGQLDAAGRFGQDDFSPEFSFNGRFGITQNLVADATFNPDFSQVEADADQVTINERFAIFFPEKRPFFLEGTEIYQSPLQLVYTRSIVDPIGGGKLTGKLGAFDVGYLGAVDESPLGGTEDARAAFNILRLRRSLGAGSNVGFLYTDRSLLDGDGFNRVLGVDARLLVRQRYALTAQLAESWTREAGSTVTTSAPIATAILERTGRTVNWRLQFEDVAPGFRARSGFIRRTGDARAFGQLGITGYGTPGAWLERYAVGVKYEGFFHHDAFWDGRPASESEIEIQPGFTIRGGNTVNLILRSGQQRFEPADFDRYEIELPDGGRAAYQAPTRVDNMLGLAVMPRLRLTDWLSLNGRLFLREVPIFAEGARGFEVQVAPTLQVWPTDGLALDMGFTRSRLDRSTDGSRFSTQSISRVKTQYQFSKSLFARLIGQYNLVRTNALRDPATGAPVLIGGARAAADARGEFGFNGLIAYEPSPGKLVYVGWTRQMNGPYTYALRDLSRTAEGLFLKFSWLHRM